MQSLILPALPPSLCPALAWSSCSSEFLLILFIGRTRQSPSPSQSPWQSQPLLRSQFVSCQPRPALPPSLGALLGQLIEIFIYSLFFCLCQQQLGGFSCPALAIFITAFFSQPPSLPPSPPPLVLVKFALGLCRVASITARRIVLDAQTKVLALAAQTEVS